MTCDHLTHTHLVTCDHLTHTLSLSFHHLTHTSSHLTHPLTASSIRPSCHTGKPQWPAQSPETAEGAAARVVAAGAAGCLPRGRRSIQSGRRYSEARACGRRACRRAWSPLAAFRVAGAVSRASRRLAARVVAAGCPRGRRSSQSLQKGLRRALSPLVPLAVCVAGAVSRASRRACGARCRRWCRWLPSAWQAQ